MNKILTEMAIHAGFRLAGFDANGMVINNRQEIEWLAQQIVQECATLVDDLQYTGKQLKEHFGVKDDTRSST
jgi:hypothetical protein